MITELEFQSLASQGFNRIPLISEAFADLETPLSLYLKLCASGGQGRHSFLLFAGIGGGGRALWALFLHRPASAHRAEE